MNRTTFHVLNGHTLGFVLPDLPAVLHILSSKPQLGATHTWLDGQCAICSTDKLTSATVRDFEAFRVSPKGHITGVANEQ